MFVKFKLLRNFEKIEKLLYVLFRRFIHAYKIYKNLLYNFLKNSSNKYK